MISVNANFYYILYGEIVPKARPVDQGIGNSEYKWKMAKM
jgi:hypothetical protein